MDFFKSCFEQIIIVSYIKQNHFEGITLNFFKIFSIKESKLVSEVLEVITSKILVVQMSSKIAPIAQTSDFIL